jgi:hypothetical protein
MEKQTVTAHMNQLCFEATDLSKGVTKMKTMYRKEECLPMRTGSTFLSLLLMLCFATALRAQEQANEIVCSSGTACKSGFIPLFSSNGGSAKVSNSVLSQSGSTVNLSGNLAAGGSVSGSVGSFSGNVGLTGDLNLANSGATAGNVLKGGILFLHNFGFNNTFLGQNAGNLTMAFTANNNTAIGANALPANTMGCCNTATGNNALLQNTTGGGNTATGDGALYTNSSGNNNTALGRWALISNTTASNNTATGVQALQSNSTGSQNTATGTFALQSNSTGSQNTAMGTFALQDNTNGTDNTAIGQAALAKNCSSPCSLGQGGGNTASGTNALFYNTTGNVNTATGYYALINNTSGNDNTAMGHIALYSNTTGTDNTAVGHFADVSAGNLTNATAIGAGAIVNASNKIRLGNTAVTVVEGPPYSVTSDKTRKENFKAVDAEEVLRKVRGLSVTSWNYIGHDPQLRHYGPVAQDFFAAFGHDGVGTIGSPTTITSTDIDGVLLLAVQALEKRTAELVTLKAENADLKARLEKLERASGSHVLAAQVE